MVKAYINAIVKVLQSVLWSAMSTIICQATLDSSTSGTLFWNYLNNDILNKNDTVTKEKAEAIPAGVLFSRGIWFAVAFGAALFIFSTYFEVADVFKGKRLDELKQEKLRKGLQLTKNLAMGGSVSVTIDPSDSYFQSMENHLDHLYETNRDQRDYIRDSRAQWVIANRNSERLIALQERQIALHEATLFQVQTLANEMSRARQEADIRRS